MHSTPLFKGLKKGLKNFFNSIADVTDPKTNIVFDLILKLNKCLNFYIHLLAFSCINIQRLHNYKTIHLFYILHFHLTSDYYWGRWWRNSQKLNTPAENNYKSQINKQNIFSRNRNVAGIGNEMRPSRHVPFFFLWERSHPRHRARGWDARQMAAARKQRSLGVRNRSCQGKQDLGDQDPGEQGRLEERTWH